MFDDENHGLKIYENWSTSHRSSQETEVFEIKKLNNVIIIKKEIGNEKMQKLI